MGKYDWGTVAGDTVTGAATGSAFGPAGTFIGGALGFAKGLFGSKKKKKKKLSTMDKKQQMLNDEQYAGLHGEGPFSDIYSYNPDKENEVFDKTIASKAYRDWNEKAIPSITGQFRSQGLANSSYVGDALSKSGRDVQESLDAQRAKYLNDADKFFKTSKQSALENFQNRQTFAYEKQGNQGGGGGGFNIDSILKSITPENIDKFQDLAIKYLPGGV